MEYNDFVAPQYPSDGLIGVEIQDPTETPVVARTIQTGDSMPNNITAYIDTDATYICNSGGTEQTSIPLPTADNEVLPCYYINVTNNLGITVPMLVTMNVYDSNGVPIALISQEVNVGPHSTSNAFGNFNIPSWAHYGTATAYVDVYSTWPSQGGVPYGLEYPFQFTITGGTPFSGTPSIIQSASGYYNFSYLIPKAAVIGTYTVSTSANYLGVAGSASTTFQVAQLGDLNNEGEVNFTDLVIFVGDYIAYYDYGTFNAAIDYTHNGKTLDFADLLLFVHYYIIYWSP
jgi:hypothetical protein